MTTAQNHINEAHDGVKGSMHTIKGALSDAGHEVAHSAKRIARDVAEAGTETLKSYADQGAKQLNSFEELVRKYPLRSLAIAAVAGVFLSRSCK